MASSSKEKAISFLCYAEASLLGVGFLPKAPGTFGSAAALLVLFIPYEIRFEWLIFLILVSIVISLPIIKYLEKKRGSDPSFIVIDEAIGIWLVLLSPFIPHTIIWVSAGFLLFRLFDIWKPFPIGLVNKKQGALFVILDDILAAVFASILLHIFHAAYVIAPLAFVFFTK